MAHGPTMPPFRYLTSADIEETKRQDEFYWKSEFECEWNEGDKKMKEKPVVFNIDGQVFKFKGKRAWKEHIKNMDFEGKVHIFTYFYGFMSYASNLKLEMLSEKIKLEVKEKVGEIYGKKASCDYCGVDIFDLFTKSYRISCGLCDRPRGINFKLTEKFPFIKENCYLIAEIDQDGKQKLKMEYIKIPEAKGYWREQNTITDEISCIHTAVCSIPVQEFIDNNQEEAGELFKEVLNIKSSENLEEIKLCIEQKFIAFKSWVAGIAEAGLGAFYLQQELDKYLDQVNPIATALIKFMIKVDSEFIWQYMDYIEKTCRFEGEFHKSSLIANCKLVFASLQTMEATEEPKFREIIKSWGLTIDDIIDKPKKLVDSIRIDNPNQPIYRVSQDESGNHITVARVHAGVDIFLGQTVVPNAAGTFQSADEDVDLAARPIGIAESDSDENGNVVVHMGSLEEFTANISRASGIPISQLKGDEE